MIAQRLVALAMIALEAATAEVMFFRFEWLPVVLAAIAAAATPGLVRVRMGMRARLGVAVAIGVLVTYATQSGMLFANLLPVMPILPDVTYPIGWCLLTIQVAMLFLRTDDGKLPVYFPAYGATVMAYIGLLGQSSSRAPGHSLYHAAALVFVVLTVLYWASGKAPSPTPIPRSIRRRGALFQGLVLAVTLSVAFVTSTVIGANQLAIDATFVRLIGAVAPVSKVGFSTQSRLGSVKRLQTEDGKKVALRVYAAQPPEYLRGRVYDTYDGNQWTVTAKESPLETAGETVSAVPKASGTLFAVENGQGPYESLTVAPASLFEGCLFAPLSTAFVRIVEATPTGDANGNLRVNELSPSSDYQVITAAPSKEELPAGERRRFLELPAKVDPGVRGLAARLFEHCSTAEEKSAAVVRYFADNYTYQIGIEVPADTDPMTYFLLEQPPAHCEYFATGAALLLRLGGVPCRYVTGFVAADYNDIGGYWVARNRDGHAWVEVYDDAQKSWVTVEATVAAGVPSSDAEKGPGLLAQLRDFASYVVQAIRTAVTTGDWSGVLPILKSLRWALMTGAAVAFGVSLTRYLRRRRKKAPRSAQPPPSPEAVELLRLRKHMDRAVRRRGLVRRPEETIKAFADRIAAAASAHVEPAARESLLHAVTWYAKYNEARFRGPVSTASIAELKRTAHG